MPASLNKKRLCIAITVSFLLWMVVRQYLFCPSYAFNASQPFSGSLFYNPYDSAKSAHWVKCNFHAHTNAWYGLTHGKGNARDVYRVYDSMNYAVHCISDYQQINSVYEGTLGYIPAYEHGYNAGKTHQLVLGSTEVKWIDYLFPQSLSNKQHVLNCLNDDSNLVIVNHPLSFHGYNASDFRYLSNYSCMEVLSPYAVSTPCWDTALSNGKPVFIVGDDDEHNIFSKKCVARMCTCINVVSVNQRSVLDALKQGRSYGVMLGSNEKKLPVLNSLQLRGDTITLEMSDCADKISFIGQDGRLLQVSTDATSASYKIKSTDHYVRTVIDYSGGTSIFLNPVFRYDKKFPSLTKSPIDPLQTNIKRISGLILFVVWIRIALSFIFIRSYRRKSFAESLVFQ